MLSHSIPFFGSCLKRFHSTKTNYFAVCRCKVLPSIVCFRNVAFRLREIRVSRNERPAAPKVGRVAPSWPSRDSAIRATRDSGDSAARPTPAAPRAGNRGAGSHSAVRANTSARDLGRALCVRVHSRERSAVSAQPADAECTAGGRAGQCIASRARILFVVLRRLVAQCTAEVDRRPD